MSLAKSRTRIFVVGGGEAKVRQISPSASDVFLNIGYLGGTTLNDNFNMMEIVEEAGNLIDVKAGSRVAKLETTLKQSTIDEINLVKNSANIYYDFYYKCPLSTTYVQEISVAICKIVPGPVLEYKNDTERTIKVTIYFLAPAGAFTRTPTAFNVVENVPYVITETASANGAPSDTAATLATAVL